MPKLSIKTKELFASVLKDINPQESTRKKVMPKVEKFLSQLNKRLKANKLKAQAVLGGSYAKDTWLEGDYDVDIFVLFDLKHKHQDLSNLLHTAIEAWHPARIRGSRDYFHIKNTIFYEIIPALDIKNAREAENTTDFSSKHVGWMQKNSKNLANDIRLFKKFCKANKVYGAESYIKGISGHVADLLVINYKGFWNALCAIAQWKPKVIIDLSKTHKTNPLLVLNANKTQGPLVLIDPVQPERNASAAISQEKFDQLISAAKKFIKKPSKNFFEEIMPNFKKLSTQGTLLVLSCTPLSDPQDIAGTKILKVFEYLEKCLVDFGVKKSGWQWNGKDNAQLWYLLKQKKLSSTYIIKGPPLRLTVHVAKFKKAHPNVFMKNTGKYVFANVKREFILPKQLLSQRCRDQYVLARVKKCDLQ